MTINIDVEILSQRGTRSTRAQGLLGDQVVDLSSIGFIVAKKFSGRIGSQPVTLRRTGWFAVRAGRISGTIGEAVVDLSFSRDRVTGSVGEDSVTLGFDAPARHLFPTPIYRSSETTTEAASTRDASSDQLKGVAAHFGDAAAIVLCQMSSYR